MPTSAERIAALRAAVEKMTEPEWRSTSEGSIVADVDAWMVADFVPRSADRAGIVALRNEAAWLLEQAAKVERLERVEAAARAYVDVVERQSPTKESSYRALRAALDGKEGK